MIDNIMGQQFIDKLNRAIDGVILEKEYGDIDYNPIEEILLQLINIRIEEYGTIEPIHLLSKQEMIKILLDFFSSLDEELYQQVIDIVLHQSDRIKLNLYNVHTVKDFSQKDKYGIPEYDFDGSVRSAKGYAIVHAPLQGKLTKKESQQAINDDNKGTLEDLFTLIHEIAHTLDYDLESETPHIIQVNSHNRGKLKREKIPEIEQTSQILCESTAIGFEGMFAKWLVNNRPKYKGYVMKAQSLTLKTLVDYYAKVLYAKLVLAKEKERTGEISIEFLKQMMEQYGLTAQDIRNYAGTIIHQDEPIEFQLRYVIAALIAPSIVELYDKKDIEAIKQYLNFVKNNNMVMALSTLGINLSEENIEELIAKIIYLNNRPQEADSR